MRLRMKPLILFITALCFSLSLLAQSFEQLAVDYFALELLPELTNKQVLYDGKVSGFDTYYSTSARRIIFDFTGCHLREARRDSLVSESEKKIWLSALNLSVDTSQVFELPYVTRGDIEISGQLVKRKKLSFWSRKRSLLGRYFSRFWHQHTVQRYNLFVRPVVKFEDTFVVLVEAIKRDGQYCDQYYIQISKGRRGISVCKGGWVA